MYRSSYAEVLQDTGTQARELERQAFAQSIQLLRAAEEKGRRSREAIEAIYFVRRLWSILLEDLGSADNSLPPPLRASLISVGLWIMREAELIRMEQSDNFKGIADVSATIEAGLA